MSSVIEDVSPCFRDSTMRAFSWWQFILNKGTLMALDENASPLNTLGYVMIKDAG